MKENYVKVIWLMIGVYIESAIGVKRLLIIFINKEKRMLIKKEKGKKK